MLDTAFKGPLGIRFGLDGMIGLIPGVGDVITGLVSLYILFSAASLGVSTPTIIRMLLNVIIENVLGLIPIAGNLFDFYWKSNTKNIVLLERYLSQPFDESQTNRIYLASILMVFITVLAGIGYLSFLILKSSYNWLISV